MLFDYEKEFQQQLLRHIYNEHKDKDFMATYIWCENCKTLVLKEVGCEHNERK